jgi:hypothetical protein
MALFQLSIAGTEDWIVSLRGFPIASSTWQPTLQVIKAGATLQIQDQWYTYMNANHYALGNAANWDNGFRVNSAIDRVTLRYDDAFRNCQENGNRWTLKVNYSITTLDSMGSFTFYGSESLTISYDMTSTTATYTDKSINQYAGLNATLTVSSIYYNEWNSSGTHTITDATTIPSSLGDIFLDLEQVTERYYFFNGTTGTSSIYQHAYTATNNLHLAWAYMQGAESYDLEFLFIDVPQGTISASAALIDFSKATRINTTNQYYDISLGYPRGRLAFRVRGVGRDPLISNAIVRKEADWDYVPSGGETVNSMPSGYGYDINGLNSALNWQYGVSYAEDGKRKEVQKYFDGSLRNRQSLTVLNSDRNVQIAETKYDYQGRPAVQILPAIQTGSAFLGIHFYNNVNPFTASDFDASSTFNSPNALSNLYGASKYYSPNNPDLSGANAYIPDAGGYPYTQTSYMNDGTHRIRKQSGVGAAMKFGTTGKETRYFYGRPTDQTELDRLFGTEVGNFTHYKKNMVEDPNGQVSISYLDQEGRVVATALAGNNTGGNLLPLDNAPGALSFTANLGRNNLLDADGNMTSTSAIMVAAPSSTYTFSYSLSGTSSSDPCLAATTCLYDVEITIYDQDGNLLTGVSPNPKIYTAVSQVSPTLTFIVTFPDVGSYSITKVLRPNLANLAAISANYVANQTCLTVPTLDNVTPEPCSIDCHSACIKTYFKRVTSLGDTIYVDNSGAEIVSADKETIAWPLLDACRKVLCNLQGNSQRVPPDPCQQNYKKMIDDMSPGGQYFDNLPTKYYIPTGTYAQVVNPNYTLYSSSYPTQYINGWLSTQPDSVLAMAAVNNTPTTGAHAFTSWSQVRANWESDFSAALFKFHPEYCAYNFYCGPKTCFADVGLRPTTYGEDSVYHFDSQMFAANVANGTNTPFLNPMGLGGGSSSHVGGSVSTSTNYRNYMPSYMLPWAYTWSDPFFNPCTQGFVLCSLSAVTNAIPAATDLLQKFIRVKDVTGTDVLVSGVQNYYSIWYLLEDPDGIATVNGGGGATGLDTAIVRTFNNFQNMLSGTGGYISPPPTKLQVFTGIYKGIKSLLETQEYKYYHSGSYPYELGTGGNCANDATLYSNGYLKLNATTTTPATGSISPGGFVVHYPENKLLTSITLCGVSPFDYQTVMGTVPSDPNSALTINAPEGLGYDRASCLVGNLNDFIFSTGDLTTGFTTIGLYYTDLAAKMTSVNSSLTSPPTVTASQISAWIYQSTLTNPSVDTLLLMPVPYTVQCGSTVSTPFPSDYAAALSTECSDENLVLALNNATSLYQSQLQTALQVYLNNYATACMTGLSSREIFTMDYTKNEYDYTLYYYDQAGNLVKTIPPDGVNVLTSSTTSTCPFTLSDVSTYRSTHPDYLETPIVPTHTMVTHYWYNSLQQLTKQYTPDGDSSWFWYDKIGRLVLSQNRRQQLEHNYASAASPAFSYTRFDNLSRIVEVGKVQSSTAMDYATSRETVTPGALSAWFLAAVYPTDTRREVTSTYYDTELNTSVDSYFGGLGQQNIRGRVASVTYSFNPPTTTIYDNAIHYSYDIHGNAQTVIKENNNTLSTTAGLGTLKRTDYKYDLVAGNLNQVTYQAGQPDEFDHQYEYDSDNRITKAFSSRNGIIWEKEAKYFYYPHGPMSRTEYGDKEVQGMDYAYTLEGRIKGVNSTTLIGSRDMGYDGEAVIPNSSGANNLDYTFAKDIYLISAGQRCFLFYLCSSVL